MTERDGEPRRALLRRAEAAGRQSRAAPALQRQRRMPAATDVAPQAWEILTLLLITVVLVLLWAVEAYSSVILIGPFALGGILGFANLQMASIHPAAIWTPLFAVRLSIFVFLCLGSLVPLVFGPEAEAYLHRTYHYSEQEFAKVLLIWCVSTTLLIVTAAVMSRFDRPPRQSDEVSEPELNKGTLRMGLAFLIPGLLYTLAYEFPTHVGWYELVLPGSILKMLQAAQAVGFFLVALWALERGGIAHLAYLAPLAITIFVTLITYNKTVSIYAMLFVALALLYHGISLVRVTMVALTLLLTFSVLKPMIAHARGEHYDAYGSFFGGTIEERLDHSLDYLRGERRSKDPASTPFTRLNFTAPAAFVIARFDMGLPSQSIEQSAWTLIPRVVWPDKPEVSAAGRELYILVTGRDTSRLAMTGFADIYWNLGWYGIFGILAFWGALLWKATSLSFDIVRRRQWLMMPFALLCFEIGLSIDGAFVTSVLAPTATAVVALFALRTLLLLQRKRRRAPPRDANPAQPPFIHESRAAS